MRLTAIVPAYPPRSRVGAWLSTHRFLAHAVACGHHVDVFARDRETDVGTLDGVSYGPAVDQAMDVAVALSDVVVSHLGDIAKAAHLASKWDKPNVRMAHGHISDPELMAGAALVVFNSQALAESVDCQGPSVVCHPPVVADEYRTEPGDRVTLINLSEAKGGELFWRLARCSDRKFLGVRGGYGIQYIDQAPNVEVIPTTPNMRDDVYARTRILLMPSERETWGMTAVEAMASGIPVIAHRTPGLVESIGSAGIFVDRDNGQGWLDEIERLHDEDEWAEASKRALERSAELDPQADLDRFVQSIESLHCTGAP